MDSEPGGPQSTVSRRVRHGVCMRVAWCGNSPDWCPSKKKRQLEWKRDFETLLRRQPSASSRKFPETKPVVVPDSGLPAQNSEEINVCGLSHLSVISCYGSPSKRMHCQWAWGFLWYEENTEIIYRWLHTTLNILKLFIEGHSFNGWMLRNEWHSVKLFEKKRAHKSCLMDLWRKTATQLQAGSTAFFPLPHGSYPWTGWGLRLCTSLFRAVNF